MVPRTGNHHIAVCTFTFVGCCQEHELEAALEQLLQQAGNQHATDEVLGEIIMETGESSCSHLLLVLV